MSEPKAARRKVTRVHVNSHAIRANRSLPPDEQAPPIVVRRPGRKPPEYATAVEFVGRVRIVYTPNRPLACGAEVYVEAVEGEAEVLVRPPAAAKTTP